MANEHEVGILIGLLVGEGHFGGDGRQPQITLRMHVRHEALFRWLERTFPGGRLYGPYDHGGRRYYQWMVRGEYLRRLLPTLQERLTPELDAYAYGRFLQMCDRYRRQLRSEPAGDGLGANGAGRRAGRVRESGSGSRSGPEPPQPVEGSRPVDERPAESRAIQIFRTLRQEP